jgi:uncharacterized membrane protein YecN with MAPEG domain
MALTFAFQLARMTKITKARIAYRRKKAPELHSHNRIFANIPFAVPYQLELFHLLATMSSWHDLCCLKSSRQRGAF